MFVCFLASSYIIKPKLPPHRDTRNTFTHTQRIIFEIPVPGTGSQLVCYKITGPVKVESRDPGSKKKQ